MLGIECKTYGCKTDIYWAIPLALRKNSLNQTKSKWFFCSCTHMKKHIGGRYMTRLSYQTDLLRGPGESLQPPPKNPIRGAVLPVMRNLGIQTLNLLGLLQLGRFSLSSSQLPWFHIDHAHGQPKGPMSQPQATDMRSDQPSDWALKGYDWVIPSTHPQRSLEVQELWGQSPKPPSQLKFYFHFISPLKTLKFLNRGCRTSQTTTLINAVTHQKKAIACHKGCWALGRGVVGGRRIVVIGGGKSALVEGRMLQLCMTEAWSWTALWLYFMVILF